METRAPSWRGLGIAALYLALMAGILGATTGGESAHPLVATPPATIVTATAVPMASPAPTETPSPTPEPTATPSPTPEPTPEPVFEPAPEPEPTALITPLLADVSGSAGRVWAAILYYFPEAEWEFAYAVSDCESDFNPNAVGKVGELGVFQVRPEIHGQVPADIEAQVEQAAGIYYREGWGPWSCAYLIGQPTQ